MPETHSGPLCPSCMRLMKMARTVTEPDVDPAIHVFKCTRCAVSFITEDHLPVAGTVVH